jgi:hypothetical protein
MQRVAIGLGIDGDGFDPHPARCFDDPAGDLAAVGNQYSFEHLRLLAQAPEKVRRGLDPRWNRFSDKEVRNS